jgi:hypothetical protein
MPDWQYRPFPISQAGAGAIGRNAATTADDIIVPGLFTVTPLSMAHITVGRWLNFNGGIGSPEDVQVLSVSTTQFTANFVNSHSGGYTISSQRTVDIGTLEVNQAGTGVIITLYDGHPNAWVPGVAFAVINPNVSEPTRNYRSRCNRGLFYIATSTGVFGNYTVTYHDRTA